MKFLTLFFVVTIVILASNTAMAGGRHHKGYYHGGYYTNHYKFKRRGPYEHYTYHGKYGHDGHYAAYAIGGLILGGIIGSAITSSHQGSARYYDPYVERRTVQSYGSARGYFRRESNGECFLVNHNDSGSQVFTPVPSRNCE